jgi:hypothetical protein
MWDMLRIAPTRPLSCDEQRRRRICQCRNAGNVISKQKLEFCIDLKMLMQVVYRSARSITVKGDQNTWMILYSSRPIDLRNADNVGGIALRDAARIRLRMSFVQGC